MSFFDALVERRIQKGFEDGLFDDLEGYGKPIPDLDQQRPEGWWAARLAKRERSKLQSEDLDATIAKAMPAIWRLGSQTEVVDRVAELNDQIDRYNRRTTWTRRQPLNPEEVVGQWRNLQDANDQFR